jgi:hypothetical protein
MLGCQSVPPELAVKGPQVAKVHATGVQIYTWDSEWKLKAPEATFTGDITGKHYAGPTWESADGSKVKGHKLREHPVDGAIPWLLLDCTAREGTGKLSQVTYIQRLNTTGGKAPSAAGKSGDEMRVPYTADYVFYGTGAEPAKTGN